MVNVCVCVCAMWLCGCVCGCVVMSGNRIGAEGAAAVGRGLAGNSSLVTLHLTGECPCVMCCFECLVVGWCGVGVMGLVVGIGDVSEV